MPAAADRPNHPLEHSDILEFLDTVFEPGDAIEFRSIRINRGGGAQATHRIITDPVAMDGPLDEWLHSRNQGAWGVYVGANPRLSRIGSGKGGTSTDGDVGLARACFVDFDDATPTEAIERISNQGLPEPTLLIHSGRINGTHAYWCFDEALDDLDLWTRYQITLNEQLRSDVTIKNPSRIMRLPGSMNHTRGNPCRIIARGKRLAHVGLLSIEPAAAVTTQQIDYEAEEGDEDWDNLNSATLEFLRIDSIPEGGVGTRWGGRNAALVAAAMDFKANGFSEDNAKITLGDARAIGRDDMSVGEAYRTIANAYRREVQVSHVPITAGVDDWPAYMLTINVSRSELPDLAGVDPRRPDHGSSQPQPYTEPQDVAVGTLAVATVTATLTEQEHDAESWPLDNPPGYDEAPDTPQQHDPSARGTVGNVKIHRSVGRNNKPQITKLYRTPMDIAVEMHEQCNGWPKRATSVGLFHLNSENEITSIGNSDQLFAMIEEQANLGWHSGMGEDLSSGEEYHLVTYKRFTEWARKYLPGEVYEGVAELPHEPLIPGYYYAPTKLPPPTGDALNEFIHKLNPETEVDRRLMLAALLTPGWGGPPGTRPIFVFASDHGQGSGKTVSARAFGDVWGGAFSLDYQDDWDAMTKKIMSSDGHLSRVFLFDNIKGRFGTAAIESAVTAKYLTGWKNYVGTIRRPNDATIFLTFNSPELTRDIAERAIIIKLGKPLDTDYGNGRDFVGWITDFLAENRQQLVSDCLAALRREPAEIGERLGRWSAWQYGVLAKVGGDMNEITAEIKNRRPEADIETEDALGYARALVGAVQENPTAYPVDRAGMVEVNARLIRSTFARYGLWMDDTRRSDSRNVQTAVSMARRSLGMVGLLTTSKTSAGKPRRVSVESDGTPVAQRDSDALKAMAFLFNYTASLARLGLNEGERVSAPLLAAPEDGGNTDVGDLPI